MPQPLDRPDVYITPELERVDDPKISKALEEYHGLRARHRVELDRLTELEDRRHEAVVKDRTALAKAIRADTADPGDRAAQKADAEILACRRRCEALILAVNEAGQELVTVVNRQRDAWVAKLAQRESEARAAFAAAIESLAEAQAALTVAKALEEWAVNFPTRQTWRPGAYLGHVPALVGRNGEPLRFNAVLDGLRALAAVPEPKAPADRPPLAAVPEAS